MCSLMVRALVKRRSLYSRQVKHPRQNKALRLPTALRRKQLPMNRRPLSRTKAHLSRENPRVPIHLTPPLRLVAAVLARDLRTLLPHQMVDHRLLTAVRRMPDLHRTQVLVRRAVAIRGLLLETALLVRVRLLALPAAVPPLLVLAINGHQASQA